VLLAGAGGADWLSAAKRVAERLGVELGAYQFGVDLLDAAGADAPELGPGGTLLVRPDGFVA
jgi:putative polyketide hydroxylase